MSRKTKSAKTKLTAGEQPPAKQKRKKPVLAQSPESETTISEQSPAEDEDPEQQDFMRELDEYNALYDRGKLGETYYTSAVLHRLAGRYSIIRELQRAFVGYILRFTKPESEGGEGFSIEEAIKMAQSYLASTTARELFDELKFRSVGNLFWSDFDRLFKLEPAAAEALWKRLKTVAREDFESGSFAAQIFETTEWRHSPWRRAQYVGIRDAFIDDYKPRGAIELSMVDMAVTSFFLYYYWTEITMQRTDTRVLPELFTNRERKEMEKYNGQYDWVPPRVSEQDSLEHAAQMADRFRRQYLSAVRALRDYRRYSVPVTINNPQQVNIAAEGGQQVNVSSDPSTDNTK